MLNWIEFLTSFSSRSLVVEIGNLKKYDIDRMGPMALEANVDKIQGHRDAWAHVLMMVVGG